MKKTYQALSVSVLTALQTSFLPINLALVLILFFVGKQKISATVPAILTGSFFASVFGNLNFGICIIGFSFAVFAYTLLRRFLPRGAFFLVTSVAVALIVWEGVFLAATYISKV